LDTEQQVLELMQDPGGGGLAGDVSRYVKIYMESMVLQHDAELYVGRVEVGSLDQVNIGRFVVESSVPGRGERVGHATDLQEPGRQVWVVGRRADVPDRGDGEVHVWLAPLARVPVVVVPVGVDPARAKEDGRVGRADVGVAGLGLPRAGAQLGREPVVGREGLMLGVRREVDGLDLRRSVPPRRGPKDEGWLDVDVQDRHSGGGVDLGRGGVVGACRRGGSRGRVVGGLRAGDGRGEGALRRRGGVISGRRRWCFGLGCIYRKFS
jgi:hypothetical protein